MKAVRFHEQGPPSVLRYEDCPDPEPGPDEVLLQVRAASVNHLDIWVRRQLPGVELPRIPGADAAGIVGALGEGVTGLAVGDRVLLLPGTSCGSCGSCAEGQPTLCRRYGIYGESFDGTYCSRLVAPAANCLPIPEAWDFAEAAAFPLVAVTAWRMCMVRGGLSEGEDVLILGASGGVGALCIQVAKLAGCRVLAAASTPEKLALCEALGADVLLPYTDIDWVRQVKSETGKRGADVTIDTIGKATWNQSLRATRAGGRVLTCGATTGHNPEEDLRHIFFRQLSIIGSTMGNPEDLQAALAAATKGQLRPVIDRRLPLEEAQQAHELVEGRRVLGKVVLEVS